MLIAALITIGIGLFLWLSFKYGQYMYRWGKEKGQIRGWADARDNYKDVIKKQSLQLIKFQNQYRDPKKGNSEWVVDFGEHPVRTERGTITRVINDVDVEFVRQGETVPIKGTINHITIIIPDSPQEC